MTCKVLGIHEVLGADWKKISIPLCNVVPEFCTALTDIVVNHGELDIPDKAARVFHYYPNGVSLKNIMHFGQMYHEDRFQIYADNYSVTMGAPKDKRTLLIPLQKIDVPVAMLVGKQDDMTGLEDPRWAKNHIGDNMVYYEEIEANHFSFMLGKDMTYMTETVIDLLQEYHPTDVSKKPAKKESSQKGGVNQQSAAKK